MRGTELRTATPVWLALVVGLAVVLLRPPLPIDETRYLEVFRESLLGNGLLLRLGGEPYAEKPPLLFWLGRLLVRAGLPLDLALRLIPPLATALALLFVERIGRRAGLTLAGWVQAALWLPLLAGQMLLFDALLSASVWGALQAWTRRRDGSVLAWSAAALLAKGPVALLFLVPLLWALHPLRGPGRGDARRAALALGGALLLLAAWALAAARAGGPEFASALLWDRWGARIAGAGQGDHARPTWFYVPVVLVGALPATFLLWTRRTSPETAPAWRARLAWALVGMLGAFLLIRGKQAHYLVPAAPGLALLVAWRLEHEASAPRLLRRGLLLQLALLLLLVALAAAFLPRMESSFTSAGRSWLAGGHLAPFALAAAPLVAAGLFVLRSPSCAARTLLALALAGSAAATLPLHWVAGRLLHPAELAAALRDPPGPVACFGSLQHGLFARLAERTGIVRLQSEAELLAFARANRDARLVVETQRLSAGVPAELQVLARDTVHRMPLLVLSAREEPRVVRTE